MGVVVDFFGKRQATDDPEEVDILNKLDSGRLFAATLVIVDRRGRSKTIQITRSCDLVRSLLPEIGVADPQERLQQQPNS